MATTIFQCAACGVQYLQAWTDQEALQEFARTIFADVPLEECVLVCEACYIAMAPPGGYGRQTPE